MFTKRRPVCSMTNLNFHTHLVVIFFHSYFCLTVDCLQELNFYTTYWFSTLGTLGVLLMTGILHQVLVYPPDFLIQCIPSYKGIRSLLQKSMLVLVTIMYPAVALKSLALWNCITVGDSAYLVADLTLKCQGSKYTLISTFNVCFVAFFVAGWLVHPPPPPEPSASLRLLSRHFALETCKVYRRCSVDYFSSLFSGLFGCVSTCFVSNRKTNLVKIA